MKFKRQKLLKILESVKPGVSAKEIVDQATCFAFKDGSVFTFNDDIAVSHKIDHELTGAVEATPLYTLLSKMPDSSIDITTADGKPDKDGKTETFMHIKGATLKAKFKIRDVTMPLDTIVAPSTWYALPEGFIEKLKFVLLSVSSDLSKPILTCVHWSRKMLESCDNFRLSRAELKTKGLRTPLLIPGSNMAHVTKYELLEYSAVAGWVHFKTTDGCTLSCRVYEGAYVDLNGLIDTKKASTITFPTMSTTEVLERVDVLAADIDPTQSNTATLAIDNNVLTISSNGKHGSSVEELPIECTETIQFVIRIDTLIHVLKHFNTAVLDENKVALKFEGNGITHVISLT